MPYVPPPPPLTTLQERVRQGILDGLGLLWPSKFNPNIADEDGKLIGHQSIDGLARGIGEGVLSGIGGYAETNFYLSGPQIGPASTAKYTEFNPSRPHLANYFGPLKAEYLHGNTELDHMIAGDTIEVHMHFSLGNKHLDQNNKDIRFRVWMDLAKVNEPGTTPSSFVFLDPFDLTAKIEGDDYAYQTTNTVTITKAAIGKSSGIGICVSRVDGYGGDSSSTEDVFPIALGVHYLADRIGTDSPFPPYEVT